MAVASYTARIIVHGNPAVDQASNDILGACPVGAEAALTTSAGRHVYIYRFDRSVPGKGESELGAFHSLELPYVFGTFQTRAFNWLPFSATDQKLSQIMQAYWTNFAKNGDPNGQGLSQWDAMERKQGALPHFQREWRCCSSTELLPNLLPSVAGSSEEATRPIIETRCRSWNGINAKSCGPMDRSSDCCVEWTSLDEEQTTRKRGRLRRD